MDLDNDHFSLLGLPRLFRIDPAELDARYRTLQHVIHPDRFASGGAHDRRLALQWATRINEAYETLKRPLARARYLLRLAGHEFVADDNTLMSGDFLVAQMEWREAVGEAKIAGDHHQLERLHRRLKNDLDAHYEWLSVLLDDRNDPANAADSVRRLMFLEKLQDEIESAMATCSDLG